MPKGAISGIINIAFLVISIGTGVFVVRETQNISSEASGNLTTLSLNTNQTSFAPGDRFAVSLKLNSGSNPVGYVKTLIHYDPHKLNAISIAPGSFFENQTILESKINSKTGEVLFVIENAPGTVPVSGNENVAIIVFQTLNSGEASIAITPSSHISINSGQPNQLTSFNQLAINIK
ncbi:MAG: hypothetical protein D6698_02365 [Gammaproteobacteria bacterium]|nr:MAG: hypothetical protein D6698_02365 [Gammaproteobacteria bacterium]